MTSPHPLYRALVRLYPSAFQHEYGEDLVMHYADLVADLGPRAARTRTALDLAVTIPRHHLECLMTEQHSATALGIVIALFAAGGVASVMTGVGPGLALFAIAGVLAVTQRSSLARALRVPDSNRRRRRLRTAAIVGAVFVVSAVLRSASTPRRPMSGTSSSAWAPRAGLRSRRGVTRRAQLEPRTR